MTPWAGTSLRRLLAPLLASLALALSLVAPLLDAAEADHGPVVESAHDPSACVRGHDHSICTQIVASSVVPGDRVRHGLALVPQRYARLLLSEDAPPTAPYSLPLGSRAPPLA